MTGRLIRGGRKQKSRVLQYRGTLETKVQGKRRRGPCVVGKIGTKGDVRFSGGIGTASVPTEVKALGRLFK